MKLLPSLALDEDCSHLMHDKDIYPLTSELDIEQVDLVKLLLAAVTNLIPGVIKRDLAVQMNTLSTIVDIACSMHFLLQLDQNSVGNSF